MPVTEVEWGDFAKHLNRWGFCLNGRCFLPPLLHIINVFVQPCLMLNAMEREFYFIGKANLGFITAIIHLGSTLSFFPLFLVCVFEGILRVSVFPVYMH